MAFFFSKPPYFCKSKNVYLCILLSGPKAAASSAAASWPHTLWSPALPPLEAVLPSALATAPCALLQIDSVPTRKKEERNFPDL